MVHKLKVLFATLALAFVMVIPVAAPAFAGAATGDVNITGGLCAGSSLALGTANCNDNGAAAGSVSTLIRQVINIISVIVGIAAVIMIIVGGLRYITSGGDSSSVTSAKNTILYAIVGLVVVALAQIIVKFVVDRLQNATA